MLSTSEHRCQLVEHRDQTKKLDSNSNCQARKVRPKLTHCVVERHFDAHPMLDDAQRCVTVQSASIRDVLRSMDCARGE